MSMYDIIEVRNNLFGIPAAEYQTKDFECNLSVYTIADDGKIVLKKCSAPNHPSTGQGECFNGEVEISDYKYGYPPFLESIHFTLKVKNGQVLDAEHYFKTP